MNKKTRKMYILLVGAILMISVLIMILYHFNILPHRSYDNAYFGIETLKSSVDKDQDGIDDQSDILMNARNYINTHPKYKSVYYQGGYPDDGYGVCSDVVAFALKDAGYDLQVLVDEDIAAHPEDYDIEVADANIDFRRVRNLLVYFQNHALSLTTDIHDIEQWQGGDIVVFFFFFGIVWDKRNKQGIPFLIHHASPFQFRYEEDVLGRYEIIAHFRISE